MSSKLFVILMCLPFAGFAQYGHDITVPRVRLGSIIGNHLENGRVVRPSVKPEEILANPMLIVDSPGYVVSQYKCSMMSSDDKYWGPFVIAGPALDPRIIARIKEVDFIRGRVFIENIHLKHNGVDMVTNNIIIDYSK